MTKQREFSIYVKGNQISRSMMDAENITVREVNPALDKAIEGLVIAIEKMLEMYPKEIFDGNSGDEGPQRIVDAYNALAAYKAAKEGEK